MLSAGLPEGTMPKLERPGPLRERVYEALLQLITTRALRPGQHLVESELAQHLGVSRQPVREALQRLNTDGWVDLRPAQGAFVHEPTEDEADQLLTVRTLLEAEAARRPKADANDPKQVAAPMPGLVVNVAVKSGDAVLRGQKLLTLEAMKMETTLYAEQDGAVADVLVQPGTPVEAGDLVVRMS